MTEKRTRLLSRLIEALPIPVVGIDGDLCVRIWNSAAEHEFGWSADEVLGKRNPAIPLEIRAECEDLSRRAIAGLQIRNMRSHRIRRDGTRVDILFSNAAAPHAPMAIGVYFVLSEVDAARRDAERELRERDTQLRLMLDQLPAMVYTTDTDLTFTTVRGSLELSRCLRAEVGQSVADAGTRRSGVVHALRAVLAGAPEAHYTYETDDRVFDARVEPLRDDDGSVRGTVVASFDVTDRHRARETVRLMARQLSTMQEDERRRIARELHDEMGQQLTSLAFELSLLRKELGEAVPAQRLDAMLALVRGTTGTMRRVVADLRPTLLDDAGFAAAIEHELVTLRRRLGIAYVLELPEDEPPLDREATTALFRIIQESLTNVARHSEATHVRVSVTVDARDVAVEVADNGRGITPGEVEGTASLGIVGVRERAWAFGGDVSIEGAPREGTRVRVRLPRSRSLGFARGTR